MKRIAIIVLGMFSSVLFYSFLARAAESNDLGFQSLKTYEEVQVKEVRSADTIILEGGKKIRLIGLLGPAAPTREKQEFDKYGFVIEEITPYDSMEERAFHFVESLLTGKMVRVEFDTQRADEDFVTLAYVFLKEGNVFVNAEILRQGYANLQIRPPNIKYAEVLRDAYREARQEQRGLQAQ